MVVTKAQQDKFQTLMRGTILSLCQNVLEHKTEIKVQVFFGITVDKKQDFHFSVVETLSAVTVSGSTEVSKAEARVSEAPPPLVYQSPSPTQPKDSQRPAPRTGTGSMLERLMTQGLPPVSPQADCYKHSRDVSPLPRYCARDVSSSTVSDPSLSYSELLRSFGEMSRQDSSMMGQPQGALQTALLSGGQQTDSASHSAVNNTQTTGTAVHSPGQPSTATPVSRAALFHPSAGWNDSSRQPRTKKSRHKEPRSMASREEDIPPDSTFSTAAESSSYGIKIKQEVMSEEETELQEAGFQRQVLVPPRSQGRHELSTKDDSPSLSNDSSASSQGILMSLLCEKLPDGHKRQGRNKKRLLDMDPPYNPGIKSSQVVTRKEQPELRDSRVLIGLTDYLPGFKDGDINRVRAPNIVFSAQDIIAKTRKVVLLNRGSFSTVRMVHRSLQGMKAYEISEIMQNMSRPRGHPEYVGEYKVINMVKVRQGRKTIGVFYKCPPEFISVEALAQYDIHLDDYNKFYCHVFRYDRVPQPQYFQAILESSPYAALYNMDNSWQPVTSQSDQLSQAPSNLPQPGYSDTDTTTLGVKQAHYNMESEEPSAVEDTLQASTSQEHDAAEADSRTDIIDMAGLGLRITTVKTEKGEWDTEEAFPEYIEATGDRETAATPVTSTQRSWADSPQYTQTSNQAVDPLNTAIELHDTSQPLQDAPVLEPPISSPISPRLPSSEAGAELCQEPDAESPTASEQDYNREFGTGSAVYSQPVFPQPLVVQEGSSSLPPLE